MIGIGSLQTWWRVPAGFAVTNLVAYMSLTKGPIQIIPWSTTPPFHPFTILWMSIQFSALFVGVGSWLVAGVSTELWKRTIGAFAGAAVWVVVAILLGCEYQWGRTPQTGMLVGGAYFLASSVVVVLIVVMTEAVRERVQRAKAIKPGAWR